MNCFAGAVFASRLALARDYLPEGVLRTSLHPTRLVPAIRGEGRSVIPGRSYRVTMRDVRNPGVVGSGLTAWIGRAWRIVVELIDADGTVREHEVNGSGGTETEYSPP